MSTELDAARRLAPAVFERPLAQRVRLALAWAAFAALTVGCFYRAGFFDLDRLVLGMTKLGFLVGFMFPPAANGWFSEFFVGICETLGMAFIGTLLAALVSLPLGFLGARNVMPGWLAHFLLRRGFDGLRGIDQLIWALIFVNVVGLGPFAGIMAIFMSDTGTLSKLFAEAIENIDRREVDGVKAAGGGRLAVMRFGIWPQVAPVMLSNVLYYFESNTRSATILGIVGAGGIGLHLSDRIRVNAWDEACLIIIMILVTVSLIDVASRYARTRFIRPPDAPLIEPPSK